MKNVYYERLDEGLYYVLQTDRHKSIKNKKIVIAAYLYYEESLQYHIDILKRLPEYISVRLITSDKIIYGKLSDEAMARKNWEAVLKENRGRDISALLVSCKDLFYKYDLLCFLHDKKEKKNRRLGRYQDMVPYYVGKPRVLGRIYIKDRRPS